MICQPCRDAADHPGLAPSSRWGHDPALCRDGAVAGRPDTGRWCDCQHRPSLAQRQLATATA